VKDKIDAGEKRTYWLPYNVSIDPDMLLVVELAKRAMQKKTGVRPNKIKMELKTYDEVLLHPDFMATIDHTTLGKPAEALMATFLGVEKIGVV